ncbi:hypothetical protein E3Q16_02381 [Wallemia mellicola]|nr:hypothetical protein E3Q16_02381 [Wallemia mellicola]
MNIGIILPLVGLIIHGYQIFVGPRIALLGYRNKPVTNLRSQSCIPIPEFEGCEDIRYHPSGNALYLSCAPVESRLLWGPGHGVYKEQTNEDFIGKYDLATNKFSKMSMNTLPEGGLGTHGIDVVDNSDGSATIYLVNHAKNELGGPDFPTTETVEVYKTDKSSNKLTHVRSFNDQNVMYALNAVASDGKGGIYFTNDKPTRVWRGLIDQVLAITDFATSTLGHCNAEGECKSIGSFVSLNGIARIDDDHYVINQMNDGKPLVMERQPDDTLVQIQQFHLGSMMDNVSYDPINDELYIATMPQIHKFLKSQNNPYTERSPVRIYRLRKTEVSEASYKRIYGEPPAPGSTHYRWRAELILADDGTEVSTVTTVARANDKLYMSGYIHPTGYVCDI